MGGTVLLEFMGGAADEVAGAKLAEGTRGLGAVPDEGEAGGAAASVAGVICGVDDALFVGFADLVEVPAGVGAREADGNGLVVFPLFVVT